jgi:hypothetical protein
MPVHVVTKNVGERLCVSCVANGDTIIANRYHAWWSCHAALEPGEETSMKPLIALAFVLMSLLGIALAACEEPDADVYDNEIHNGYPGPGTKTPDNRGG